jgi:hypothetical protein
LFSLFFLVGRLTLSANSFFRFISLLGHVQKVTVNCTCGEKESLDALV